MDSTVPSIYDPRTTPIGSRSHRRAACTSLDHLNMKVEEIHTVSSPAPKHLYFLICGLEYGACPIAAQSQPAPQAANIRQYV